MLLWAVAPPSLEASTSNTPGPKTIPPALGVAGSVQLEPGSQEEKRDSPRTPLSLAAAWGCEHRNFRTNSRLFTCGFCSWWLFTFLQCWEGRSWASRALAHGGESAVLTDSVSLSASLHPRGHWLAWQAGVQETWLQNGGWNARSPGTEALPPPTVPASSPLRGDPFPRSKGRDRRKSSGEE